MKDQSLEQRRAGDAYNRVREAQAKLEPKKAELYASYAKALPTTILQAGLGQAMAMLLAAAKGNKQDPHHMLYRHVSDWLCGSDEDAPYKNLDDKGLIEAIISRHQGMYVQAQVEALAYMDWIKKFATAYLQVQEQSAEADGDG